MGRLSRRYAFFGLIVIVLMIEFHPAPLSSATYPGWLIQDTPMAFTLNQWEGELTVQWLMVNSAIDFMDIRGEVGGGSRLFTGDSGDLNGGRCTFNLGVLPSVMLFYSGQRHEIVTELGESHTFGSVDSDRGINTWSHEAGIRWNFLDVPFKDLTFAIEGAWIRHTSRDFSFSFLMVDAGDVILQFGSPREIRLSSLSDDGWRVRFIGSMLFGASFLLNFWAGYEAIDASSAISTNISYEPIKKNFDRRYSIKEDQLQLGIGMIWQVFPRVPFEFYYEYLHLSRSERSTGAPNTSSLARYTNPDGLTPESSNHIFTGKIGYWLTPNLNINIEGKLMTNQFLGIVPHYNNTVTSRFFDQFYGYIGLGAGYAF